jgi:hypothetical protein
MRVFTLIGSLFLIFSGANSCNNQNVQAGSKASNADTVIASKREAFIIEVVGGNRVSVDTGLMIQICQQNGLTDPDIYKWKDHYVVYGSSSNLEQLGNDLRAAFPSAVVKVYRNPFYKFNRALCQDKSTAKEWDHIILTANLVKDTVLQKEYMDYHATQFQQWPEVSKGFCNASFQELLLFRNGRQLMLVISIPEGESMDQLNPKTTENNPRVDEWNVLMKKYQEGIEGTKPGEVWAFFERQM